MTTTALMRKQLFINNEWRDAVGGTTIEVVNPATEEVIAEVASADKADVDAAVAAARAALDGPWGKLSARERGKLVWKIGEKLVVKAASPTPLTAIALAEIAAEVGVPAGVLNVVTGPGSKVGQMIVEHPGIDKIAFTGDTSTGKGIMKGSADTLKRITLELGGKSPNIVFPDADIESAIRGATTGIFYGKGEVCAAGSRLLVDKSIKDAFMEKLAARAKKMVAGDPLDPKTRYGALASKKQLETVQRYVETARTEGASRVAGGG